MFQRIMIGLFALSLTAIWASEANAWGVYKRASVKVTVIGGQNGDTFVTDIFGLPGDEGFNNCGTVTGTLYCTKAGFSDDACDSITGYSKALVLAADLDLIKPMTKPNKWKDTPDLNGDITDFGQREQLRIMEQYAFSADATEFTVYFPTGETDNKAGILAISDAVLDYWMNDAEITADDALRKFVGSWNVSLDKFIPDDGFGINGEDFLQALPFPGMIPISGTNLSKLVGHTACFVVHSDQITGDDLHGKYRGTFAGHVLSATTSSVTMEILDADEICALPLYNNWQLAVGGPSSTDGCYVGTDVVFAPDQCSDVTYTNDAFLAQTGTIDCSSGVCMDTVEVETSGAFATGCEAGSAGSTFSKFIPTNRGGSGTYANYAFIGTVESDNPALREKVICGEGLSGGVEGVEYMRYGCVPFVDPVPDCCYCSGWLQAP